ncbi:hypothetical protein [Nocardia aurantiaca]|uniref:Uncharacterized protein n=1 Tax=Nocardia aurantiaca TaxID=2675850 RepID=A0A6I3L3G8_9NOCA|nr:hypothetical protein [Nocardia aurantiaca]MTE15184.1 hypothetical protein [Nocardia aurantiaca]
MASRDIMVTVGDDDWHTLNDAAECAGMSVEAYVSWGVRLLAMQTRPGGAKQGGPVGRSRTGQCASELTEESASAAWTETFAQRLSHRADRHPPDTELWL